jgi:hypothetical protein
MAARRFGAGLEWIGNRLALNIENTTGQIFALIEMSHA